MSPAGAGDRGSAVPRPAIYLVVGPAREMGLSDTPRPTPPPWSFTIPEGADRYQVLREARDTTSVLHRLVTLQVAMMAEAASAETPDAGDEDRRAITRTALATGREKIVEAMSRVGNEGYDAMSVAVLRAALAPLVIGLTRWTLFRVRSGGERRVVGVWARTARPRWSGPIRTFDRAALAATTGSGTRYELIGDPSDDGLDAYLVRLWLTEHDLSRHDVEILGVEDL